MTSDNLAAILMLVTAAAGGVGFGHWMNNWGAGLVAFAVLSLAYRFSSK